MDDRKIFFIIKVAYISIPVLMILWFLYPIASKIVCSSSFKQNLAPPPVIEKLNWKRTGLITIWFDDAWISQYKSGAFTTMQRFGFKGAVSVPTDYICNPSFLTWEQLHKLQSLGWEITSQTKSHMCRPERYAPKTIKEQIFDSKSILEKRGFRVNQFVMPCGINARKVPIVTNLVKQSYTSFREISPQINPLPVINPYALKAYVLTDNTTESEIKHWLAEAAAQKGWLILVVSHVGIKPGDDELRGSFNAYNYVISHNFFESALLLIKNSGLPVVVPTQALTIKKY